MDKAGKSYWDKVWKNAQLPKAVDPLGGGLNNYVNRKFHSYFRQAFSSLNLPGKKLLEIGCARSAWLPYFAKEFGFEVSGLDYSELGCEQARTILVNEGVKGEVICGDAFSPPTWMIESFDVVVSFGVVEHFQNTSECLSAFSRLVRPGGAIITTIPNFTGLNGALQRRFDREVFDIHLLMTPELLAEAHRRSGLQALSCGYFLAANFSVINVESMNGSIAFSAITRLCSWSSKLVWSAERLLPFLRPNRWTSPYINCLALKPCV